MVRKTATLHSWDSLGTDRKGEVQRSINDSHTVTADFVMTNGGAPSDNAHSIHSSGWRRLSHYLAIPSDSDSDIRMWDGRPKRHPLAFPLLDCPIMQRQPFRFINVFVRLDATLLCKCEYLVIDKLKKESTGLVIILYFLSLYSYVVGFDFLFAKGTPPSWSFMVLFAIRPVHHSQ